MSSADRRGLRDRRLWARVLPPLQPGMSSLPEARRRERAAAQQRLHLPYSPSLYDLLRWKEAAGWSVWHSLHTCGAAPGAGL